MFGKAWRIQTQTEIEGKVALTLCYSAYSTILSWTEKVNSYIYDEIIIMHNNFNIIASFTLPGSMLSTSY